MKILIKGDIHNRIEELRQELILKKPDLCLQVGDFGLYSINRSVNKVDPKFIQKQPEKVIEYLEGIKDWPVRTVFVPGNHEDMEYIDDNLNRYDFGDLGTVKICDNLYMAHATVLHPYVDCENNVCIYMLGKIAVDSSFELDKNLINSYGLNEGRKYVQKWVKKRNHLHYSELTNLAKKAANINKNRKNTTVIWISHDAPPHTHPEKPYKTGHPIIGQMLDLVAPDYAFFGHYHYDLQLDNVSRIVGKYNSVEIEI